MASAQFDSFYANSRRIWLNFHIFEKELCWRNDWLCFSRLIYLIPILIRVYLTAPSWIDCCRPVTRLFTWSNYWILLAHFSFNGICGKRTLLKKWLAKCVSIYLSDYGFDSGSFDTKSHWVVEIRHALCIRVHAACRSIIEFYNQISASIEITEKRTLLKKRPAMF